MSGCTPAVCLHQLLLHMKRCSVHRCVRTDVSPVLPGRCSSHFWYFLSLRPLYPSTDWEETSSLGTNSSAGNNHLYADLSTSLSLIHALRPAWIFNCPTLELVSSPSSPTLSVFLFLLHSDENSRNVSGGARRSNTKHERTLLRQVTCHQVRQML